MIAPKLPLEGEIDVLACIEAIVKEVGQLDEETIILGHSLGAVLALPCAALFAVRDNAVRFVARGADAPPLAASAASLLGASAVVLLYLLVTTLVLYAAKRLVWSGVKH